MEALEIERQTDQTPLARRRLDTPQGELAKAEHLLDDADHRFDRAFACPDDGDHAPWRCRVQCCASHTPPASRGRCTRYPARLPRAYRVRTGWQRESAQLLDCHWGDWRARIPRSADSPDPRPPAHCNPARSRHWLGFSVWRDSGSLKLYWSPSRAPGTGGVGRRPRG